MEHEILHATAALVTALARGDAVAAADVYTDDARLVAAADELIRGRAAIEAYWRAGLALGVSAVGFESFVVEAVGPTAAELGRYAVSVDVEPTRPTVERGTYFVLHRQAADGSWRRALDVFEPDEPMAAERTHPQGGEQR